MDLEKHLADFGRDIATTADFGRAFGVMLDAVPATLRREVARGVLVELGRITAADARHGVLLARAIRAARAEPPPDWLPMWGASHFDEFKVRFGLDPAAAAIWLHTCVRNWVGDLDFGVLVRAAIRYATGVDVGTEGVELLGESVAESDFTMPDPDPPRPRKVA